ncbi:MAG: FAD binding domain-containing protein [Hyphomicrobiales bacterium]
MGRYERPPNLEDALEIIAGGGYTILAGGTDFYPARANQAITEDVLDLTAIDGLRGISEETDHWRLGSLVTWSELVRTKLPPCFDGYKKAAREVGGLQIQNAGTLAGNLCNASPAADGTPNLVALEASIELSTRRGMRRVPVEEFVVGNRATLRREDEIVTAILVPKPRSAARSTFLKLGTRRYLVISIVMVAAVIEETDGRVDAARLAVGSCSAVPQRLGELESALSGKSVHELSSIVYPEHFSALAPIDDVRGTAEYRKDAAFQLTRRALLEFA